MKTLGMTAAAAALGISRWTLRRWVERDLVPYMRTYGGHYRWDADTLAEIKRHMREHDIEIDETDGAVLVRSRRL